MDGNSEYIFHENVELNCRTWYKDIFCLFWRD